MKRRIKSLKQKMFNWLKNAEFSSLLILSIIVGIIFGIVAFKSFSAKHLTEAEVTKCTEICNKIIDSENGKINKITAEIKNELEELECNLDMDYLNSKITFEFQDTLKELLIFDFSSNEDISIEKDYFSAQSNRTRYIAGVAFMGLWAFWLVVVIIRMLEMRPKKRKSSE